MDFDLTEEQRAIQDTARAFARDEMMPFARQWDEDEFFPVETLRQGGGARLRRHLCARRCRRLGAVAARRHAHLRGAGAGLPLDRRLHLDPQHGGVDDRRLRREPSSAGSSCPRSAPWTQFASYCLTEPDAGSDAASLKTRAVRHARSLRARRHQGVHLRRRRLRHLSRDGAHRGGRPARHLLLRGREGHARAQSSARRRRSSAGSRSRPPW